MRFLTCGSVDDGKSTLIGRLISDAAGLHDDQIASLRDDSRRFGTTEDEFDFALLLDGLEAEREQGITIDVAYRFFSTARRAFVVADTPGHQQYTRNMATGASNAELAILLVDARKGLVEQTRRHAAIVSLLGIRHVVLAVNKIDLVEFSEARFREIEAAFAAFAAPLAFHSVVAIPLSARLGDNVAVRSGRTPWYAGPALLAHLETVETDLDAAEAPLRFPVQWVNRPDGEFRGFSGTVASGRVAVGDPIVVSGSGRSSTRGAHRELRRRPAVGRRRPFGDADAGRRGRRDPWRRAGRFPASAGGRAPLRRRPGVDGRDGGDAGQALSAQDRHGHRARHAQPHRRHARRRIADPRAGDLPGPQRHRPRRDRGGPGRGLRRLCREPADRRLHPDRPVDAAHGGGRHGGRERSTPAATCIGMPRR